MDIGHRALLPVTQATQSKLVAIIIAKGAVPFAGPARPKRRMNASRSKV